MDKNNKISKIVIEEEDDIPVLRGPCPRCNSGDKTLIIINFVKNTRNERLNIVKIKCISCLKEYYKYVAELTKNKIKKT